MSRDYSRTVSSEEARCGYVMVLKDRLGFFPPVGRAFTLQVGKTAKRVKVDARPCTCRGPEKSHEHYFIRLGGLSTGQRVVITRKGGEYAFKTSK